MGTRHRQNLVLAERSREFLQRFVDDQAGDAEVSELLRYLTFARPRDQSAVATRQSTYCDR